MSYFVSTYMEDKPLNQKDAQTYGIQNMLKASWHCGTLQTSWPGHPASQQVAEMLHRKVQRDILLRNGVKESHIEVCEGLSSALRSLWTQPLSLDTDRPITMRGFQGQVALCCPPSPDEWMVKENGKTIRKHGMRDGVKVPSIKRILEKQAQNPDTIRTIADPRCSFYVMRLLKPKPVQIEVARSLVKEVQTKDVRRLQEMWLEAGLMEEADDGTANSRYKIVGKRSGPCGEEKRAL